LVETIADVPMIPVPGNHEEGPNLDFVAYEALYGDQRFSFDYAGWRFVGFNNSEKTVRVSKSDLLWVEEELSKPGADHKVVMLHVPPAYLVAGGGGEAYDRGFNWNAEAFHALMCDQGVELVFCGHLHGYATEVRDGVRYTITGGGGAPLSKNLGEKGNVYNYVIVNATPSGPTLEVMRFYEGQWQRDAVS
jgi:3',5'-cyclic AMP phosphodiesterase CpdA